MATIDELLENLGVNDSGHEKTAGSNSGYDVEKAARELGLIDDDREPTTKIASQLNGGQHMQLHELYEMEFEGNEKIASQNFDYGMNKEAAELVSAGEAAGRVFARGLNERLMKVAMDMVMDSEATQERQEGPGVIPSGNVANPQLEVNRPDDADEAMNLDPQYYDLLDQAVQKKVLEKAIADGQPGNLSHKVVQVDTGLEMPKSQKDA